MPVMTSAPFAANAGPPPAESWLGAWENSADSAYCRDLTGRIVAANLSFARRFGLSATTLADANVADLLHADDLGALQSAGAELARPPHRAVGEHRWRTPQGVRWFSWEETPLHDETGAFVAIRAIGRDITRQRLAEEQFSRRSGAVEQSPV